MLEWVLMATSEVYALVIELVTMEKVMKWDIFSIRLDLLFVICLAILMEASWLRFVISADPRNYIVVQ